jgi:zinc-ribbon domain
VASCSNCGAAVPAEARFCPECGRLVGSDTAISRTRSWWPPQPLVIIVVLLAAGGIALLVGGEWAWGLVVLLAAGVVFLSQREAERRAARYALTGFRARFLASREAWSARSRGQLEIFRARRELAELEAERARGLHRLGYAVFEGDKEGTKSAKADVTALVERIHEKEAEIETLIRHTEERVQRAQAGVKPTERMEVPEPARVPEPWPPPDEGDPPAPAPVPEPSPAEPLPDPEHPPMPETRARKKR